MGADKSIENTQNAPKFICPKKRLHWASKFRACNQTVVNGNADFYSMTIEYFPDKPFFFSNQKYITIKFMYSEKTSKFCEIFTLLLTTQSKKVRGRFRKILWPSQNRYMNFNAQSAERESAYKLFKLFKTFDTKLRRTYICFLWFSIILRSSS